MASAVALLSSPPAMGVKGQGQGVCARARVRVRVCVCVCGMCMHMHVGLTCIPITRKGGCHVRGGICPVLALTDTYRTIPLASILWVSKQAAAIVATTAATAVESVKVIT